LTQFHQTYINDALWDRDACVTILGSKVKVTVETALSGLVNTMCWKVLVRPN